MNFRQSTCMVMSSIAIEEEHHYSRSKLKEINPDVMHAICSSRPVSLKVNLAQRVKYFEAASKCILHIAQ